MVDDGVVPFHKGRVRCVQADENAIEVAVKKMHLHREFMHQKSILAKRKKDPPGQTDKSMSGQRNQEFGVEIRGLAAQIVAQMHDTELRKLLVPVGAVFDAMKAKYRA